MNDLAIQTEGLSKRFGSLRAVDQIDLAVPRGSVYGFLGPNGSGKTTTIRVLLGLAAASDGEAALLGQPMPGAARHVLPRVGALIEGPALYPYLTGVANLARFDAANPSGEPDTRAARIIAALERVGLTAAARTKVRAYSLGMKQRLGIAAALLSPRELLVLDEPTNGLDPQGTREVRALIRSLAADGTTVFLSSHLLAEVEQICTHVGVMSRGRLVAQGTLAELREQAQPEVRLDTPDVTLALEVLGRTGLGDVRFDAAAQSPAVRADLNGQQPEDVVVALVNAGVAVRGFVVERASLEERFVALTGEGFDVVR